MSGLREDHAGVRFPPPFVFLGFVLLGPVIDQLLGIGSLGLSRSLRLGIAIPLIAGALALILSAIRRFDAAGTRVEPSAPASHFVATGVYKFSRNPMYLGMGILSAGLALALGSATSLLLIVPAIVAVDLFVIRREEAYLHRRFGPEYDSYKLRVRRWL